MNLATVVALGFDRSSSTAGQANRVGIGCSQCAAGVVNGTPLHEAGCPNETKECGGCNAVVARGVNYCEECK